MPPPLSLHQAPSIEANVQKPFKAFLALSIMFTFTLVSNFTSAQFDGGTTVTTSPPSIDPLFQFSTPRADINPFGSSPFGWIWGPADNLLNDGYNIVMRQPTSPSTGPTFSTDFRLTIEGARMVQLSRGNIGTSPGDMWNSIGERLPASTLPGFFTNGLRSQYDGYSANFGVSDDPAGGSERHGLIQWQDISVTAPDQTTRLRFVFRDGNAPFSGGVATEVGTALFDGRWGFGVNNINPLSTVDVKGGLYVGSNATVSAPDGAGFFNNSVRIGDDAFMNGASSAAGVVVQNTRRVGIGTNNPAEALDMQGGGNRIRLRMGNSTTANGALLELDNTALNLENLQNGGEIFFKRFGSNTSVRIANNGNVKIGGASPTEKLDVDGNIVLNGNVFPSSTNVYTCGTSTNRWLLTWAQNGSAQTSDLRAKQEIETLKYGLSEVMKLNPISYRWKENDEGKRKLGFSAQELNNVITEVVIEPSNPDELLGVKYSEIIPVLVNAIKEQQAIIEKNTSLMLEMEGKLTELQEQLTKLDIGNSGKNETILYQNEPNPTSGKTTIRYIINKPFTNAIIEVYDDQAQLVMSYSLPQKQGEGGIEFNGENLRKGSYSYTLIIDGKQISTKKLLLGY